MSDSLHVIQRAMGYLYEFICTRCDLFLSDEDLPRILIYLDPTIRPTGEPSQFGMRHPMRSLGVEKRLDPTGREILVITSWMLELLLARTTRNGIPGWQAYRLDTSCYKSVYIDIPRGLFQLLGGKLAGFYIGEDREFFGAFHEKDRPGIDPEELFARIPYLPAEWVQGTDIMSTAWASYEIAGHDVEVRGVEVPLLMKRDEFFLAVFNTVDDAHEAVDTWIDYNDVPSITVHATQPPGSLQAIRKHNDRILGELPDDVDLRWAIIRTLKLEDVEIWEPLTKKLGLFFPADAATGLIPELDQKEPPTDSSMLEGGLDQRLKALESLVETTPNIGGWPSVDFAPWLPYDAPIDLLVPFVEKASNDELSKSTYHLRDGGERGERLMAVIRHHGTPPEIRTWAIEELEKLDVHPEALKSLRPN